MKSKRGKALKKVIFQPQKLKETIVKLLLEYGIYQSHAEIVSDVLIEAELCGLNSHGIRTLTGHLKHLQAGGYNLKPQFTIINSGGAFSVFDGDNAMGFVSAYHGMELAIKGAEEKGIFSIFSRNNNTFGPGFYYSSLAAKKGFIGIGMSNSPAAMAPWKGKDKLLGTNPISIAIPVSDGVPIVLDMASSYVAKSRINEFFMKGQPIPQGWAMDSQGHQTTDPEKAINGLMMPMAEHKGYGIAMMIDILAGVLSGSAYLNHVGKFYKEVSNGMKVGFLFVVIDPKQVFGEEFYDKMKQYREIIKKSTPLDFNNPVRLPGDMKEDNRRKNTENGLIIDQTVIDAINEYLIKNGKENRLEG